MAELFQPPASAPFAHKHILENFLNSYLVERNAEKTFSLVTDDIYSLGTGVQEVAHDKAEFQQLILSELEQLSTPISYRLDTYREKAVGADAFVCLCDVTTTIELQGQPSIHYTTRLTAGFRRVDGVFLAYHLHMSEASSTQEEHEFFPLHYGALESSTMDADKQFELVELMKQLLPGGAMGGYVEPGFPLYFINDELLNWLGYTYEEFIADNGQMMSNTMHPDDVAMVETTIAEAFAVGNEYTVEYRMKKKDHSYIWVHDVGRKTIAPNGRVAIISIITDISLERLRQKSFEHTIETMRKEQRRTDRMTGLLNREAAELLIEQHLVREKTGAFFLLDIDNFKLVNDTKGHPAGDQVLKSFAAQMKSLFPSSAILVRLGGDEFVAFLPQYKDRKELRAYAEKILGCAEGLLEDARLSRSLGVSIGIALAPEHGTGMHTLYSNADKGLYFAKRNGKNRFCFYRPASPVPNEESGESLSIQTLCRMIRVVLKDEGAFKVEYDTFHKICQFVLRNAKRLYQTTQIVLFTLQIRKGKPSTDELLQECKKSLEQSVRYGLRLGDLLMDFSPTQIAVLLINCNAENAVNVAQRVISAYAGSEAASSGSVTYECCAVNEDTVE